MTDGLILLCRLSRRKDLLRLYALILYLGLACCRRCVRRKDAGNQKGAA
ncbi:MAG: hypothetical protein VB092_08830 [Oscillospiraceae bacterium]|nr:hypothetical protein [Oscillospiraceae bacterium]